MIAEDVLFLKRLKDLDRLADRKYMVCYSDFMDATEYSLFLEHQKEFTCSFCVFDQIKFLERQMIAFIPDALTFNKYFPIKLLEIRPRNPRFAQEKISHRDILGTLMGLSIERKLVGDILFSEEGKCYVLVKESIASLACEEIHRIRHTEVVVSVCEQKEISFERKFEDRNGTIASARLDCVVSELANLSRSQSLKQIQDGLVFVNQRQVFRNTYLCSPGDIISIRHVGKYKIVQLGELSKKGKTKISYQIYC
ncbi:MAG: YlmH/Sll1252 family protein [Lachnospiraceae bacterium]